jgi:hypothetical protein
MPSNKNRENYATFCPNPAFKDLCISQNTKVNHNDSKESHKINRVKCIAAISENYSN